MDAVMSHWRWNLFDKGCACLGLGHGHGLQHRCRCVHDCAMMPFIVSFILMHLSHFPELMEKLRSVTAI
jgi:hypothetical protein